MTSFYIQIHCVAASLILPLQVTPTDETTGIQFFSQCDSTNKTSSPLWLRHGERQLAYVTYCLMARHGERQLAYVVLGNNTTTYRLMARHGERQLAYVVLGNNTTTYRLMARHGERQLAYVVLGNNTTTYCLMARGVCVRPVLHAVLQLTSQWLHIHLVDLHTQRTPLTPLLIWIYFLAVLVIAFMCEGTL